MVGCSIFYLFYLGIALGLVFGFVGWVSMRMTTSAASHAAPASAHQQEKQPDYS